MLQIARHTDYAARIVLHLACLGPDAQAAIADIAEQRMLPEFFVRRLVGKLVRGGILTSTRGAAGGLRLARPAAEITLLDVVRVMEGPLALNRCLEADHTCPFAASCPVQTVWTGPPGPWKPPWPRPGSISWPPPRPAINPPISSSPVPATDIDAPSGADPPITECREIPMDVLILSRLQFAVATYFHFLFVPLTLGLSMLVAIMETIYVRSGDPDYRRMAQFWGKLFLINFAIGVVTGITLEFQFGTNWSRYSAYVGDIFGSLLAIEATVAFFLESTFIAVWFFGWKKLSPGPTCVSHLAGGHRLQPLERLLDPGGQRLDAAPGGLRAPQRPGRAVQLRGGGDPALRHPGVRAHPGRRLHPGRLLRAGHLRLAPGAPPAEVGLLQEVVPGAAVWTLVFTLFEIAQGHMNAEILQAAQPAKLAAMEAHWETHRQAPMHLLAWPDPANERNSVQALTVPGALSLLAGHSVDTEVKGLKAFPADQRPPGAARVPVLPAMVGLGLLFIALGPVCLPANRARIEEHPRFLRLLP